jgi:hypothetical protein
MFVARSMVKACSATGTQPHPAHGRRGSLDDQADIHIRSIVTRCDSRDGQHSEILPLRHGAADRKSSNVIVAVPVRGDLPGPTPLDWWQ